MAIRCASSGDRGRPPSRPLRGAEPTDLEPRGARDGAESEGARCRTFLVQIIPQRVGRTADSPKPPINPRTETGARHLNLTGAASFPAPRPRHPSTCKRRQRITDQSSITPSSTAVPTIPLSSAAFSAQREWQRQSSPKPLPHQISIDGQPLAVSRGFLLRRLSDAGLLPGSTLTPGRHPKPFTIPAIRPGGQVTDEIDRGCAKTRVPRQVPKYQNRSEPPDESLLPIRLDVGLKVASQRHSIEFSHSLDPQPTFNVPSRISDRCAQPKVG